MKQLLLISLSLLILAGCNSAKKSENSESESKSEQTEAIADTHNARNSLDYYGTYEGVTPCADCEGIKVTVTLNKDDTFILKNVYLKNGEEILPSEYTGEFSWDDTGFKITLNGVEEAPSQFFVGEGSLTILDREGNKIDTVLAEHYVLKQIETN